jgi:hypothetical protein
MEQDIRVGMQRVGKWWTQSHERLGKKARIQGRTKV